MRFGRSCREAASREVQVDFELAWIKLELTTVNTRSDVGMIGKNRLCRVLACLVGTRRQLKRVMLIFTAYQPGWVTCQDRPRKQSLYSRVLRIISSFLRMTSQAAINLKSWLVELLPSLTAQISQSRSLVDRFFFLQICAHIFSNRGVLCKVATSKNSPSCHRMPLSSRALLLHQV